MMLYYFQRRVHIFRCLRAATQHGPLWHWSQAHNICHQEFQREFYWFIVHWNLLLCNANTNLKSRGVWLVWNFSKSGVKTSSFFVLVNTNLHLIDFILFIISCRHHHPTILQHSESRKYGPITLKRKWKRYAI